MHLQEQAVEMRDDKENKLLTGIRMNGSQNDRKIGMARGPRAVAGVPVSDLGKLPVLACHG
jgi:hypothetical protein